MPFVAKMVARRGEVMPRNVATESGACTAEVAGAKAADVSSTAEGTDVSAAAEPADVSATEPADHMSTTAEPTAVSTTEAAAVSTATTSAARKRISAQSGGESGSRRQDDHDLT
jgi:hypothetical protein